MTEPILSPSDGNISKRASVIQRLRSGRLSGLDWSFIRDSSFNTIAVAVGRVLGFAFSFIGAHAFTTEEFGYITYTITLGTVMAIFAQPFGQHVVSYFIGKYRESTEDFQEIMSNVWMVMTVLFFGTILISVPVLYVLDRFSIELMFVYVGLVAFYLYHGVASGFLASPKLLAVYVGSNVVQTVIVVFLIYIANIRDNVLVIMAYGFAYFLPIALLLRYAPFDISYRLRFDFKWVKRIVRFSIPVLASHVLFVAQYTADIILLELFVGAAAVGVYGLTKTLTSVFSFLPNGITMLLMPKLAGMTGGRKSLILVSVGIAVIINVIFLAIYMLFYEWFIVTFFDGAYFIGIQFGLVMALAEIGGGLHKVITAIYIGIGKPSVESASRSVMLVAALGLSFVLIPLYGLMGAAIAQLITVVIGLATYVGYGFTLRNKKISLENLGVE